MDIISLVTNGAPPKQSQTVLEGQIANLGAALRASGMQANTSIPVRPDLNAMELAELGPAFTIRLAMKLQGMEPEYAVHNYDRLPEICADKLKGLSPEQRTALGKEILADMKIGKGLQDFLIFAEQKLGAMRA